MTRLTKLLFSGSLLLASALPLLAQQHPEDKAGWKLAAQAYSFNRFTFADAIRKTDSCGLKYVEAYPGQTIGGGLEGKMDFKMDQATRQGVKKMLKDKGLTLVAYGVIRPKEEADWKALFEFAKEMGIQNINSEPEPKQMSYIGRMAQEYKINVAMHNHPKPSHYWHPDSVLAAIGTNKYLGACADIGHWVRSGLDPVDCLKKLNGRVLGMHFKDINREDANTRLHDVVWGSGLCNVDGVIAELKRQKFKGPISAEYEYHWENNAPEIAQSVQYFRSAYTKVQ